MIGEMEDKPHENTTLENEGDPAKNTAKSQHRKSAKSHPPTSKMVNAAIKELNNRKGSSLQLIKKYIATTYKVDIVKLALFIRRYLKSAVSSGAIVQTSGKNASGSFKLPTIKKSKSGKIPRIKRIPTIKKAKKSAEKKVTASEWKPAASRKPSATKRIEGVKKSAAAWKCAVKATTKRSRKAKPAIKSKTMSKRKTQLAA